MVKNRQNLRTLRYAHNSLKHDAFIENCPNLKPENIDKHNYDGKLERGYDQKDDREKFNQKLNAKPKKNQLKKRKL